MISGKILLHESPRRKPGWRFTAGLQVFLKKLSFYAISNQVLDFLGLKHDIVDLYARWYASL